MKIAALFLWLLVPLSVWGAIAIWGTPHIVLTYRYIGPSYLPPAERKYLDCDYLGIHGWITATAIDETCPWVRFFKADDQ